MVAGFLSMVELRRLVKKYDDLMGIDLKDKKFKDMTALRNEIKSAGYTIDDVAKKLVRTQKGKNDKKKRPVKIDLPAVEKKPPVDKSAARAKKKEMIIKTFMKDPAMHKEVMEDERVK